LSVISLPLFCIGDVTLGFQGVFVQQPGVYKDLYGPGVFQYGGTCGIQLARGYRSNLLLELEASFSSKTRSVLVDHIGGTYTYERKVRRSGYSLELRYEWLFSKDGFSLAAGVQRDYEKETVGDFDPVTTGYWRPLGAFFYEMFLGEGGKHRIYLGPRLTGNVNGNLSVGFVLGLRTHLNLFRRFEG